MKIYPYENENCSFNKSVSDNTYINKNANINNNIESIIGDNNSNVKDLVEDIYSGMSVKNIKEKYSSNFNINFNRNWSWENRVKNADKIISDYVTIDDYVSSEPSNNGFSFNSSSEDSFDVKYSTSESILDEIYQIQEKTFEKIKNKKSNKIKNYNSVFEGLNKTLNNVHSFKLSINEKFERSFDESIEVDDSWLDKYKQNFFFEDKSDIYDCPKSSILEELISKKIERDNYERKIIESEKKEFKINEEQLTTNISFKDPDTNSNIIPISNHPSWKEKVNETYFGSEKQREVIESNKKLASNKVKLWFSEMTKVKNPAKLLESKLNGVGYTSRAEKEVAQVYIGSLIEELNKESWKTIFRKENSWFSKDRQIKSMEKAVRKFAGGAGLEYKLTLDLESGYSSNKKNLSVTNNGKNKKTDRKKSSRYVAAAILGISIGISGGGLAINNELNNMVDDIDNQEQFHQERLNHLSEMIGLKSKPSIGQNMGQPNNDLASLVNNSVSFIEDDKVESDEKSITEKITPVPPSPIERFNIKSASDILDTDLPIDIYQRLSQQENSDITNDDETLMNSGDRMLIMNFSQEREKEHQAKHNALQKRLPRFESLKPETKDLMVNAYNIENNSFNSGFFITNSSSTDFEIVSYNPADGKIQVEHLNNGRFKKIT